MSFPSEQQAAVMDHRGKPLIVVAGPGTGKTRTLVERMICLLAEDQSREVSFITFTRTSRRDTHGRLETAFGDTVLDQPQLIFPRASTLHTYAKSLLHRYAKAVGRQSSFSILIDDKGEKDLVLGDLVKDLQIDIDIGALSDGIFCYRCTGEWPYGFPLATSDLIRTLEHWEELLRFYSTFDMEGIVIAACTILTEVAEALPALFLEVDEYQDLNPMDQRLVGLAASHPSSQVVVVADDAQSIYSFRHARYQGVRTLWESSDWERCRFPDSYRLPAHILNAALDLIADEGYLGAEINRKPDEGRRIVTLQCTTSDLQVKAVARHILDLIASPNDEGQQQLAFRDFLVLCPTTSFVDNAVEFLRDTYSVPAHKPTRSTISEEYWKLILVLRMVHSGDPLALRQWLPVLGFDDTEILDLRQATTRANSGFFQYCLSHEDNRLRELSSAIGRVRDAANDVASFQQALDAFPGLTIEEGFVESLSSQIDPGSDDLPSFGRLIQLIYAMFGVLEAETDIPDADRVLVATLHSAKGLEAEYVYCMWMNRTLMPMANYDPAEQRRVLYVALARARRDVVLTFHEEFDQARGRRLYEQAMSPFLHEIRSHLDIRRVRADDLR